MRNFLLTVLTKLFGRVADQFCTLWFQLGLDVRGLEGLDNGSPGNLNDAAHVGNLAGQMSAKAYRVPPMVEAKWNVDSEIQIPRLAATDADVDRQMLEWGGELPGVDAKAISQCDMHSVSLGGEILAKTDYEPEYGSAKGAVTY